MNKEQKEVLDTVQQVLRGVVTSMLATHPERGPELAASLAAFATAPGNTPEARAMLENLAMGTSVLASAGQRRQ